ncbi:Neutral zinc metallopeptidase family [Granulibacter bethesdensis]|uniref:Neutral zinc metallopeptidase family n=2 Tax=Granulibacter bethesdensis TaxID=364410 RepID=A0AAN0RDE5_9PROT|nr:Neutral zinc metallopeptidase family [Granulibacter bethesdensis]
MEAYRDIILPLQKGIGMRLDDQRESNNIQDDRGTGGPFIPGGIKIGGLGTIAIVLVGLYFGIDPRLLLSLTGNGGPVSSPVPSPLSPAQQAQSDPSGSDPQRRFVSRILASTEDVWSTVFKAHGKTYQPPILVLFDGTTRSACGTAQSAMGPFYCPVDQKVYLDTSFFRELQERLGAGGDFARAYVIAHEVGHHVQNQLGILGKVTRRREEADQGTANALSVRLELQADCFAGVWAKQANDARSVLGKGDIEQGLNAADAIGDDRLQKRARGYIVPDSFTHGSSSQRVAWFRKGLQTGEVEACNTFTSPAP